MPSVLWEAWWALVMKKLQLFRVQVSNSHWSVKLHFFPSLWIHTDIIYFLVFIWKWKSCWDSLVAGVGSWEVGNDILPVCSSGKCFHSNPGNCYLPLWKTLPHLHICKKTNPFPPHICIFSKSLLSVLIQGELEGGVLGIWKTFFTIRAVKAWNRCPEKWCALHPWGFSSSDWINLPGLISELSRMLGWRPPKVPSHLNYSGLL